MNYVYILKCTDGSLYTGYTNDPSARYKAHCLGKGAKYTKSHPVSDMVYLEEIEDRSQALSREYAIKQMKRSEKLKMIKEFAREKANCERLMVVMKSTKTTLRNE